MKRLGRNGQSLAGAVRSKLNMIRADIESGYGYEAILDRYFSDEHWRDVSISTLGRTIRKELDSNLKNIQPTQREKAKPNKQNDSVPNNSRIVLEDDPLVQLRKI